MTAIHHKVVGDAIVTSLQTWLLARLPAGYTQPPVTDAWPDLQAQRPAGSAFLVVSAGDPQTTPYAPVLHDSITISGASATLVWRVGEFRAAAQVDVFATSSALADELAHVVSGWFSTPPMDGKRTITVEDYWGARFRVGGQSVSSGPDATTLDGQWRHTFNVIVTGPVLSDSIGKTLNRLDIDLTVGSTAGTFTLE